MYVRSILVELQNKLELLSVLITELQTEIAGYNPVRGQRPLPEEVKQQWAIQMEGLLHIIIRGENRNTSMVMAAVIFETRLASLKFRVYENEYGWAQRMWDCVQVAAWVVNNTHNCLPEWPKKLALLAPTRKTNDSSAHKKPILLG